MCGNHGPGQCDCMDSVSSIEIPKRQKSGDKKLKKESKKTKKRKPRKPRKPKARKTAAPKSKSPVEEGEISDSDAKTEPIEEDEDEKFDLNARQNDTASGKEALVILMTDKGTTVPLNDEKFKEISKTFIDFENSILAMVPPLGLKFCKEGKDFTLLLRGDQTKFKDDDHKHLARLLAALAWHGRRKGSAHGLVNVIKKNDEIYVAYLDEQKSEPGCQKR